MRIAKNPWFKYEGYWAEVIHAYQGRVKTEGNSIKMNARRKTIIFIWEPGAYSCSLGLDE